MLHLVDSSILLYLIDDARTNKNQVELCVVSSAELTGQAHGPHHVWERREQYLQESDVSMNWFIGPDTVQCMGTSLQPAHGVYTKHDACICTFLHFMKGLLIFRGVHTIWKHDYYFHKFGHPQGTNRLQLYEYSRQFYIRRILEKSIEKIQDFITILEE